MSNKGTPYGGIKRKAGTLDPEAVEAVKGGPQAAADYAEKASTVRESGFIDKAREVPTGDLMKGIQDVAISTRIAIDHASKALTYAQTTLANEAQDAASGVSKEAKRRAKEVKKAEAKLAKAIEAMRKVRSDLDSTLRGSR